MAQDGKNVNPVYVVRRKLGLSHAELADRYSVSKSTLLRTEQGLYARIPPEILSGLRLDHSSPWSISADYSRYQTSQRDRNSHLLRSLGTVGLYADALGHPFISWRLYEGILSRLEFCRLFCIHPSTVKRYEDGISLSTPSVILDLIRAYNIEWEPLEWSYQNWRRNRNTNKAA